MKLFWILGLTAALTSVAAAQEKAANLTVKFENSPALATPAGYSYAAVVSGGKMIFLSGQVGLNKQGEMGRVISMRRPRRSLPI
jgi:2-iminobutanoate/2-iminopropanoate deaminase